jgi:hypothetical protein
MRALFATSLAGFFSLAGSAWGETAAQAEKNAQARELKVAQAKCASRTGAQKERCLADAQTTYGRGSLGAGQYGYMPGDGKGRMAVSRDAKTLGPAAAKSQRTAQDLESSRLPSNQPTDVARAAEQAKQDAARAGK